jgi:tricorn protease
VVCGVTLAAQSSPNNKGYYRYPALHNDTLVFASEGDLWTVPVTGGLARRLTSHVAEEHSPRISPDGKTIAYVANYEGNSDVYTIPATGGLPVRKTFVGGTTVGWTPDGKLMFSTFMYSPVPQNDQLAVLEPDGAITRIPLAQARQGVYDAAGKTLFFTRLDFQGSWAKRYQGGTAQNLWKWVPGQEAVPLTGDYKGTSAEPMYWRGRLYFASDRDGTMNLWSMDENGKNLRQHTKHVGWDLQTPQLQNGRIVYQLGADIHLYDLAANADKRIEIEIPSDFEHLRERWIKNPLEYLTDLSLSPDGSKVVMVARGRVFVAPAKDGRLVEATAQKAARYRYARMMPDNKSIVTLSTESGEVELWKIPANGIGAGEQMTKDGKVLRWYSLPSPDGKWIAHADKDKQLWVYEVATQQNHLVATADFGFDAAPAFEVDWAPDSQWLAYTQAAPNTFQQVKIYSVATKASVAVTTDRYNSYSPAWSPEGKYLYLVSDRNLRTGVFSPWGPRAPDPYFDKQDKLYQVALKPGLRSPWLANDEVEAADKEKEKDKPKTEAAKPDAPKPDAAKPDAKKDAVKVEIDFNGIQARLEEIPVPPGNYNNLSAVGKRLCWMARDAAPSFNRKLECLEIQNKGDRPETVLEGVNAYDVSMDGKKMLLRKGNDIFVVDSTAKALAGKALDDAKVKLQDWTFSVIPTEEYKEAFVDAWRLHRDYFYDRKMHGVNWRLMRDKYGELTGRVRSRDELNNLIAQMVSELSVLHTFVVGGDRRQAPDQIRVGALGGQLERDAGAGGWVVKRIYQHDPDRPDKMSPLAAPHVGIKEGDVILAVNGRETLKSAHPYELLRAQVGKQVLLRVKTGTAEPRDVVVKPVSQQQEMDLRYHEWEYQRRLAVEKASHGRYGYIHLRAMGPDDIAQFTEQYYPVFDRQGLIIDVRFNNGGNIDSWILGKLMRKAWMYWQARTGSPTWNMQYAFRGQMVVLVNEWTASDGEAFADGFRRLGLGKVLGTRTWGGEVWLSSSNVQADRGLASAAEMGVYGPERQWLIEGHGVDPDIVVDNLPHATFQGTDAQLDAALKYLDELVKKNPNPVPPPPPHPDKSIAVTSAAKTSRPTGSQ